MNVLIKSLLVAVLVMLPALQALAAQSLDDLLRDVRSSTSQERALLAEREASLITDHAELQRLLDDAREALQREELRTETLRASFEENEASLAELERTLEESQGAIGELVGVVRQVAGDLNEQLSSSLTSAEFPDRQAMIAELAERRQLPSIADLELLWITLLQEMTESGKVSRFASTVVDASGEARTMPVARVGQFSAVSEGGYLSYVGETGQLIELGRQPSGRFLREADSLLHAGNGEIIGIHIDPSRGDLLGQLVLAPNLWERVQQGKLVGYVILALGVVGLLVFLVRFIALSVLHASINRQLKSGEPDERNPIGRILALYERNRSVDPETLEVRMDEAVLKEVPRVERGLSTIKLLAAVAPLLGLLGTVVGMIDTFQSITLFGTGDPKLMAGGISQALVTTVLGLVVAIPLLLMFNVAAAKAKRIVGILEEQGAGILATHMEKVSAHELASRTV